MSDTLHVFTSAAVNYLPKVRLLCRSIREHHPEAVIHLALADARPQWLSVDREPFDDVIGIESLQIRDWRPWSFMHSIVELSTAIKPFALRHLLALPDCARVLYFDPDMVLFSRVDDILTALDTANVALTPHQTHPESSLDAILDNEVASLKHGIFNLGFIGVANTAEGRRFVDWWAERCYYLCRADVENGLFTDQKWVNFAPVFFDGVTIIKSSRHNVATWNVTTRRVAGGFESGFTVDGEPLGFYHFTGFDSGAHRIMAIKNAASSPAVDALIDWYEKKITVADRDPISRTPWAFGSFSDGTPIMPAHRWFYRERADLQRAFPDPYDAGSDRTSYLGWCRSEGSVRHPDIFSADGGCRVPNRKAARSSVSLPTTLRLLLLALSPRRGKALRLRARDVWRSEGLGGFARRLGLRRGAP